MHPFNSTSAAAGHSNTRKNMMAKIGLVVVNDDGSHHMVDLQDLDDIANRARNVTQDQATSMSASEFQSLGRLPPWLSPVTIVWAVQCAKACKPRGGYAACLARCMVTHQACDGGISDCGPA